MTGRERPRALTVHARGVQHSYGDFHALRGIDLEVRPAEFMTLLGASGSGKSTLLQAIAGLIEPDSGDILVDGRVVTGLPPERRDMGFVFQNYALFPHMTVHGNVAFPLQMRREDRRTIGSRVGEVLELVGLSQFADRYPGELSGGQQQRVALARAITFRPGVLLLDEPLGALDRQLRQQLGLDLRRVQHETGITTIYVTHDQEEAFVLSSRIAVMREGSILQIDTPENIYRRPTDLFVATFLGDLNLLDGTVQASGNSGDIVSLFAGDTRLFAEIASPVADGSGVSVGLRPEELRVGVLGDRPSFKARVESVIFGGSWVRYQLLLSDGQRLSALNSSTHEVISEGSDVEVSYEPARALVFPASTEPLVPHVDAVVPA